MTAFGEKSASVGKLQYISISCAAAASKFLSMVKKLELPSLGQQTSWAEVEVVSRIGGGRGGKEEA